MCAKQALGEDGTLAVLRSWSSSSPGNLLRIRRKKQKLHRSSLLGPRMYSKSPMQRC